MGDLMSLTSTTSTTSTTSSSSSEASRGSADRKLHWWLHPKKQKKEEQAGNADMNGVRGMATAEVSEWKTVDHAAESRFHRMVRGWAGAASKCRWHGMSVMAFSSSMWLLIAGGF
jgi:hypothetical protein